MGYVYARGGKLSIGYIDAAGKPRQKATGYSVGDEDLARETLREVEALVEARREYAPDGGPLTLERFASKWLKSRDERDVATVGDDDSRLRLHVLPVLGAMAMEEIRPRHVRGLVLDIAKGELASRTQSNVLATMRALFSDAVADEVIRTSPVALKRHEVPGRRDADPRWRATAIYELAELRMLFADERVPLDRRVLYALMGVAGLRFGEAAALRWSDLQPGDPYLRLWVASSYSTKRKVEKSTKTEAPRGVPVIPALARVLAMWCDAGWESMMCRKPESSDLLIPSRKGRNRSVNHSLKRLHADCGRVWIRERRQHDLRRTFISLCRATGAREDLLRFITHGPSASVMDAYTTLPWATLCEQVSGLERQLTYSGGKDSVSLEKNGGVDGTRTCEPATSTGEHGRAPHSQPTDISTILSLWQAVWDARTVAKDVADRRNVSGVSPSEEPCPTYSGSGVVPRRRA